MVDAYMVPLVDGVAYGLLLFVVAAGLTLAFAVGGVLNLAHGVVFALGAYLSATVSDGSWAATGLAVGVGTGAGAGCGGLLAAALAPLRRRGHLAQALLTMGLAFVATDLLRTTFGPYELATTVPASVAGTARILGHAYPAYRLAFILVGIALAVAGWWILTRTRAGSRIRATVDDPEMVAALGVHPAWVHGGVMVAAGGLAGLAGAMGAPILGAGPTTGTSVLLISLVVVVLGGMRSVPATLLAALGVGQVQTLGVALTPTVAPFLLFAAMASALIVRAGRAAA